MTRMASGGSGKMTFGKLPLGRIRHGAPWESADALPHAAEGGGARVDHLVVLGLVPAGARVLRLDTARPAALKRCGQQRTAR